MASLILGLISCVSLHYDPDPVKNNAASEYAAESRPFQFTGRIRSFRHAIAGLRRMIRCQHNAWIHLAATAIVLAAGFLAELSAADWCWIILAISIVWTAEALNTAFEFLADAASPEFHPLVRDAKDVAAGAVLVTALAAAVIGAIIFWPHVARLFS
jgi:diacylglycerol kinase (ATP)